MDDIISDDIPASEKNYEYVDFVAAYGFPNDPELSNAMKKLDDIARMQLSEKYNIVLPKSFMAIAATVCYVENIYRELVQMLVSSGKSAVSLNFNDIIEFNARRIDDKCVITLTPGYASKLEIKTDLFGEDEDF